MSSVEPVHAYLNRALPALLMWQNAVSLQSSWLFGNMCGALKRSFNVFWQMWVTSACAHAEAQRPSRAHIHDGAVSGWPGGGCGCGAEL